MGADRGERRSDQCRFCIEDHAKRAVKAGACKVGVAGAVMVAAVLRAGGGATHGWKAIKSWIAEDELLVL
ncbi:hypothetical protein AB0362_20440 [Rhodococcus sp. NPDC079359]|uniref:hypothetical protein n=1 Tax=Rhodococcus sp. NPDC079359 TaxID=3154961 RepID=UPI00344D2253